MAAQALLNSKVEQLRMQMENMQVWKYGYCSPLIGFINILHMEYLYITLQKVAKA